MRARTGYYGPQHVARLRLIQDMQAGGFNLKSIERIIAASDGASEQVLDFSEAVLESFVEEEPEFATGEELEARLGGPIDRRTFRKAEKLGLVRPLGDGRFELPSPTLIRAAEELIATGIPVSHALAVGEAIQRHSRAIAEAFVRLFMQDVMGGNASPRSPEEWQRVRETLDRLRPLATEAVRAGFQQTMAQVVESQLAKILRS